MSLVCAGAEYFFEVPDVVWSGVLASLITLTGVWLANKNSRTQLLDQQAHATAEKNRERQMLLRREVLLDAVAWAHGTVVSIGNVMLLGRELRETAELKALGATPSRVVVTGGADTNKHFAAILLTHSNALSRLTPARGKLVEAQRRMNELGGILSRMSKSDPRLGELRLEHEAVTDAVALFPAFYQGAFNTIRQLERLQVPLILAIRKELDIPSDDAFIAAIEKVGEQQVSAIEAMINNMLAEIGMKLPEQGDATSYSR